ncbi:MAG: hypothetical protein A2284_06250 [Deltaproteobacteria bacterium RIFOXYA12_FULL_61_11]|nr:MAG: hypothetical protein A2284_06250 [Deltaproteobacteria bacterium RIFOXYA12_FULL_61_11]
MDPSIGEQSSVDREHSGAERHIAVKPLLRDILFTLVVFLGFLCCLEGLALLGRELVPGFAGTAGKNPRFQPNAHYRSHPYFGLEPNPASAGGKAVVNRHGLQGTEIPASKETANEFRIFCLGGSTSEALPVDQFELELSRLHPTRRLRVQNAATGTYSTAESLLVYLFKIAYLQPDLLLVYHAVNDVYPAAFYRERFSDYRQYRKVWNEALPRFPKWYMDLFDHSALVHLFHDRVFRSLHHLWEYTLHPTDLPPREAMVIVESPGFGTWYKRNLERLILAAKSDAVRVVLITFVIDPDFPSPLWHLAIAKMNTILRDLAANHEVALFDLAALFEHQRPKENLFEDYCHFNSAGERWRLQALVDFFREARNKEPQLIPERASP